MIINRSMISSLMLPTLDDAFFDYNTFPHLWKKVFQEFKADLAVESVLEMQGTGIAGVKPEGSPIKTSTMGQAYMSQFVMTAYALQISLSREAIKDNQYKNLFPQDAKNLRASLETVKNRVTMSLFNNGFNANSTGADGQPLFSTVHPIDGGTIPNTFGNGVAFNLQSLQDAITMVRSTYSQSGLELDTPAHALLVPQNLSYTASTLVNSTYNPNTANRAINPVNYDNLLPGGVIVNQFIDNPYLWVVLTSKKDSFRYYEREPIEITISPNQNTKTLDIQAYERWGSGYSNWRGAVGGLAI
jgi:hypothetical protein